MPWVESTRIDNGGEYMPVICQSPNQIHSSVHRPAARVQPQLHDAALAAARRLTGVLASLHLGNDELEGFLDILVVPRARLGPSAFELFGEGFAIFGGDLSLFRSEIGFVAYDDERDPVHS